MDVHGVTETRSLTGAHAIHRRPKAAVTGVAQVAASVASGTVSEANAPLASVPSRLRVAVCSDGSLTTLVASVPLCLGVPSGQKAG